MARSCQFGRHGHDRFRQAQADEQGLTPGLSPELRSALRLREKKWSPPKALSSSVLKQVPRLPLMDVLNFLTFGAPAPPKKKKKKEMSPLMRRAHWERSFKALCAAARDGKVKLFGRPSAEGPSQAIDPTEFDSPLSFDDEQGTIGADLAFARACEENRLWHDVRVDRESLVGWVQELETAPTNTAPKVGPDGGRPSSMYAVEAVLAQWIKDKRVEDEIKRLTPDEKGNAIGLTRLDRALGKRCDVKWETIGRARLKPENKSLSDLYAVALKAKK
jgi:hypothetical protein